MELVNSGIDVVGLLGPLGPSKKGLREPKEHHGDIVSGSTPGPMWEEDCFSELKDALV